MAALGLTIGHSGVRNLAIDAAPTLRKLRRRCRFSTAILLRVCLGAITLTALRLALCHGYWPDLIVVTAPTLRRRRVTMFERFFFGCVAGSIG